MSAGHVLTLLIPPHKLNNCMVRKSLPRIKKPILTPQGWNVLASSILALLALTSLGLKFDIGYCVFSVQSVPT